MLPSIRFLHVLFFLFGCVLFANLGACGQDIATNSTMDSDPIEPPEQKDQPPIEFMTPDHTTGDLVIHLPDGVKMAFIKINPGTFLMGAENHAWRQDWDRDQPQHKVVLTKGFYLGKYEVTREQWASVMGEDALPEVPEYAQQDNFPVTNVSWHLCEAFIDKLNRFLGNNLCRLPTEAEWEYSARAGTTTDFPQTNLILEGAESGEYLLYGHLWYQKNSGSNVHIVGSKAPNPWGIYNMYGNVGEWVNDWISDYTPESQIDPTGPDQPFRPSPNDSRVIRGGNMDATIWNCRPASRSWSESWRSNVTLGFRLARSIP